MNEKSLYNLFIWKMSHWKKALKKMEKKIEIQTKARKAHACVMLMVVLLDQPEMAWTVVLGFLLLGLICLIEDKVHMVLLCSATSGRSLSPPWTGLRPGFQSLQRSLQFILEEKNEEPMSL